MKKEYKINYLPSAQEDLEDIITYITRDSPNQAKEVLTKFDESISHLAQFPLKGIIPKDLRLQHIGYRILVVEKYLIFYVVKNDEIEIRRVVLGSRKFYFIL
jgi:addiction module RelE/StbE family toxin